MEAPFRPLERIEGYLPIEDHGLIGDGSTAALVGRDGAVSWMCAPRFDSPPLLCGILDAGRGGAFTMAPEGVAESRQRYEIDTGVLVTEMRCASGTIRITDALTLRSGADLSEDVPAGRCELLRTVEALQGSVRLVIEVAPRDRADLQLRLSSSIPLDGPRTVRELRAGERLHASLRWGESGRRFHPSGPDERMKATIAAWRGWMRHLDYRGPREPMVRRSAVTLKMLDYTPTGAMVAAATSSLPEAIGGPRNWDYRYSWIRDAAFSVYALRRIGLTSEASSFLGWVLDAVERGGRPRVLYDLDGGRPQPERVDPELEGYRRSAPVRWGNRAFEQIQHDVYGEILDCAYQWARGGEEVDQALWAKLRALVESARTEWRRPDQGIWEVRTEGRPFTYSAALCHTALDRGARLAERLGLPGEIDGWRAEADRIRKAILEEAWDPAIESITEHLRGGGLDASLLALPLRRVIPAGHPKMVATTNAIRERLDAGGGLLFRYLPEVSPDGLPGDEGAFLLCSFWLVDNLAKQGRLEEAMGVFDSLCDRANPLGLLPEQIDPGSGAFLGNYPQAFSHVGVIASAFNLVRCMKETPR